MPPGSGYHVTVRSATPASRARFHTYPHLLDLCDAEFKFSASALETETFRPSEISVNFHHQTTWRHRAESGSLSHLRLYK
jgi:hypothetical protein